MKRFAAGASLFLCIVGVIMLISGISDNTLSVGVVGAIIAVVFFLIRRNLKKDLSGEKARVAEVGKEQFKQEKREAKKEKREAAREAAIADQTLDYVLIAGQESRTSTSSAVARGAVGRAVLGPVGLLAAAGAKKKTDVTLVLHYKSGRTETKTVKLNSSEFKKLAPYMK